MSTFDVYMIVRLLVRVLAVAFVPTTLVFITLWLNARARARAAERLLESRPTAAPLAPSATAAQRDDRLDRLEQAVDSIAVEVERIAEGQRFTAKLLVERLGGRDAIEAPRPPRAITPH